MVYMVTFTINIPQMLAYIPYMDPMGDHCRWDDHPNASGGHFAQGRRQRFLCMSERCSHALSVAESAARKSVA